MRFRQRAPRPPRQVAQASYAEWSTPWEKLLSLPAEQRGLRADRSLKKLQARADTCSDTEFAEQLDAQRNELQRVCKDLAICWRTR